MLFFELCENEPIDKITIKEIADNCGVTSQTFDNHFSDKYDLIYWVYRKRIDAIFDEFEAKLDTYNNKKIEIKTEQEAKEIINRLSKVFNIVSVDKQSKNKKAKPPYITSTIILSFLCSGT